MLFPGVRSTHYPWHYYQDYCPARFSEYFKFAFVRNPFDRLVSAYHYLRQGGQSMTRADIRFARRWLSRYDTFQKFVIDGLGRPAIRRWGHFVPQAEFIASRDGTLQVDFVGRVESLRDDLQMVARRLGIRASATRVNATQRAHYANYFDAETAAVAAHHYADDFRWFGYSDRLDLVGRTGSRPVCQGGRANRG